MAHADMLTRLVGRDREMATLDAFVGKAAAGGATLLLTGEPGVGKTALLVAAAETAGAEGTRIIQGAGVEYETDVSFAGLHQLIDPLSEDLRELPRAARVAIEVALGIGSGPAPDRLTVLSDAMELLAHQFAHLPTRVFREVAHEAQGNPLALLEFAASIGELRDTGHRYATAASGSSREVRSLYEARVDRLPESTRRLLLLAVLDGSGSLAVLAASSGTGHLEDLEPAERDHLVVVDDRTGEMVFRHPMIKSVVVDRSTHEERRHAHLRLAGLLADQPERRAHHLAEATSAPDEDVAAAVEDGAHRTLQRGDVVGAVTWLMRAADLSPNRSDRSRRLADAAYVGAHSAGRLENSSELLRDAHRGDPTLGQTLHAAVATAYRHRCVAVRARASAPGVRRTPASAGPHPCGADPARRRP